MKIIAALLAIVIFSGGCSKKAEQAAEVGGEIKQQAEPTVITAFDRNISLNLGGEGGEWKVATKQEGGENYSGMVMYYSEKHPYTDVSMIDPSLAVVYERTPSYVNSLAKYVEYAAAKTSFPLVGTEELGDRVIHTAKWKEKYDNNMIRGYMFSNGVGVQVVATFTDPYTETYKNMLHAIVAEAGLVRAEGNSSANPPELQEEEPPASAGAAPSQQSFPFSAQEDADGARFVHFIYGKSGLKYDYIPAEAMIKSNNFRAVPGNKPQAADVAWWPEFVALYAGDSAPANANLITAPGRLGLAGMEKDYGPAKWLRFWKED